MFDDVDCGNGGGDNALTDANDRRAFCELGGATVNPTPTPTPTPTVTPPPAKKFKTNPFQTTYGFSPRIPKAATEALLRSLPSTSWLTGSTTVCRQYSPSARPSGSTRR